MTSFLSSTPAGVISADGDSLRYQIDATDKLVHHVQKGNLVGYPVRFSFVTQSETEEAFQIPLGGVTLDSIYIRPTEWSGSGPYSVPPELKVGLYEVVDLGHGFKRYRYRFDFPDDASFANYIQIVEFCFIVKVAALPAGTHLEPEKKDILTLEYNHVTQFLPPPEGGGDITGKAGCELM